MNCACLQLPVPRGNVELDYSRWMQNLIGILQIDVTYFTGMLLFAYATSVMQMITIFII